ncbi:uncharacterized protein LOC108109268 [Drosophila eugracilis]|uniref:uncharacterized protein LOC108109268 n=1 Tax=Drosophila eugracilis TaxID=29029 RepID=UPI0007E68CB1|nr:uncharacterized protein LOC108109268 [Drosophila eugracilis]
MLTSAREWELKSRQRLPVKFWMFPMWLLWCLLIPGQVLLGNAASVTWGHVGKYASVLHTEDVYLTPETPQIDFAYGSQNASDNYRITGIHVEDLGYGGAEAVLTAGGIGQQFVVIRSSMETQEPAYLELSIYGVDL